MEEELKTRLTALSLTTDQIALLETAGVTKAADMTDLSRDDLISIGFNLVTANRLDAAFAPVVPAPEPAPAGETGDGTDVTTGKPSPQQVTDFASKMGIDSNMLTAFLFANISGGLGIEMDLSSFLPIPTIVAGYNPKRRDMNYMVMGQIEKRLGTPIVVINSDGSVNTDLTTKYIMALEEGFDPAEDNVYYDDGGDPFEVIRVGVDAQSIYDADPLRSTQALQKNGMGIGRISWNGVSLEVRQIVYYASSHTHEINPDDSSQLTWLRDHIKPGVTRMTLRGQYPKALTMYNEAARTGSLPTLRVQLSRSPRRVELMPRRRARVEPTGGDIEHRPY